LDFSNVADNLRESFRVIAASRTAGEVRELPGVSVASSGVTFQMFNAAFLSGPVAGDNELAQRVLVPAMHFNSRGLEWAYWVCEDWMSPRARRSARRVFERYGLRHSVDLPGMVAEEIRPAVKPPAPLEVRRVSGGPTRDAFCAIGSVCFHVPLAWFQEVFESPTVWDHFVAYVGYADQEPVATAAIVVGGGALGVYNVATMPSRQRQGFGETVMRYALADAANRFGVRCSILQATPAGLHLYQRMGYRKVTTVAVYAS
jgi:ribosomal protein S18 acetylase RimI-like enzyme